MCLTTNWYTCNSNFYQQTDGATVGRPASSTTVEIYMQVHEQTAHGMHHPFSLGGLKISEKYLLVGGEGGGGSRDFDGKFEIA